MGLIGGVWCVGKPVRGESQRRLGKGESKMQLGADL